MKNAVTLIELIFVIVLLAVLSSTAIMAIPKNQAITDAKHIASSLTHTRFKAQGNQDQEECRELIDQNFSTDEYTLQSTIDYPQSPRNTICFDWMGRVSNENNESISDVLDINITGQGKTVRVLVFPLTGYVKIKN